MPTDDADRDSDASWSDVGGLSDADSNEGVFVSRPPSVSGGIEVDGDTLLVPRPGGETAPAAAALGDPPPPSPGFASDDTHLFTPWHITHPSPQRDRSGDDDDDEVKDKEPVDMDGDGASVVPTASGESAETPDVKPVPDDLPSSLDSTAPPVPDGGEADTAGLPNTVPSPPLGDHGPAAANPAPPDYSTSLNDTGHLPQADTTADASENATVKLRRKGDAQHGDSVGEPLVKTQRLTIAELCELLPAPAPPPAPERIRIRHYLPPPPVARPPPAAWECKFEDDLDEDLQLALLLSLGADPSSEPPDETAVPAESVGNGAAALPGAPLLSNGSPPTMISGHNQQGQASSSGPSAPTSNYNQDEELTTWGNALDAAFNLRRDGTCDPPSLSFGLDSQEPDAAQTLDTLEPSPVAKRLDQDAVILGAGRPMDDGNVSNVSTLQGDTTSHASTLETGVGIASPYDTILPDHSPRLANSEPSKDMALQDDEAPRTRLDNENDNVAVDIQSPAHNQSPLGRVAPRLWNDETALIFCPPYKPQANFKETSYRFPPGVKSAVLTIPYDPKDRSMCLLSPTLHITHMSKITILFMATGPFPLLVQVMDSDWLLGPLVRLLVNKVRHTEFVLVGVHDMPTEWFGIEEHDAPTAPPEERITSQICKWLSSAVVTEYGDDERTLHEVLTRLDTAVTFKSVAEYLDDVGPETFALHTEGWDDLYAAELSQ